jgi:flagellar capping protein FliD
MKSKKEIEQLAEQLYPISSNPQQIIEGFERVAFKKGYTQCQEDMANEIEYWKKENEKIDAKYTKEFDYWQEKAKEMTNKYNDLINKQK